MEPSLEAILADMCAAAADPATPFYSSPYTAFDALMDNKKTPFTLFKEDFNMMANWDIHLDHCCHLLMGFRALTDASFTVLAGEGATQFQVNLSAGEFQLAWRNEAPVPEHSLRRLNAFKITNLKGRLERIGGFLNDPYRTQYVGQSPISVLKIVQDHPPFSATIV